MKKYLLLSLFTVFTCLVNAQFITGQKTISGQLSFGSNNNNQPASTGNEQRSTDVSLSLSLNRFVTPTVISGFGLIYGYHYNHINIDNPTTEQIENTHQIGWFVNRTKLQMLVKKLYLSFTGTAGVSFIFDKSTYSSGASYSKYRSYEPYVTGEIGLLYQLSPRFLLTGRLSNLLNLSYTNAKQDTYSGTNVYTSTSNNINFGTGLNGFNLNNFTIGLQYMLK